jgi:glycerophosphoryl diester phosphodiesterase
VSGTTAISAHRGGSAFAKSDSYEGYGSALEAGAEYVEFDVRRTGRSRSRRPALGWRPAPDA